MTDPAPTMTVHADTVAYTGTAPAHYSSQCRRAPTGEPIHGPWCYDGQTMPALPPEVRANLQALAMPPPDPYGIHAARAWREKAYRGRREREAASAQPGASGSEP